MLNASSRFQLDAQPYPATDPSFASVVYLLQTGGSNVAGSPPATDTKGKTITNTGSVATEYGGMRFNNTGSAATQYLTTPDSADFAFGSGSFTIEMDVVINNFHDVAWVPIGKWSSSFNWLFYFDPTSLQFLINNGALTPVNVSGLTWTLNTRYHIAISRSGSTWRAFRNGAQIGSNNVDATAISGGTDPIVIGKNAGNGRNGINGLIDRIRVTKGVARYTTAFAPNFHPYPTA